MDFSYCASLEKSAGPENFHISFVIFLTLATSCDLLAWFELFAGGMLRSLNFLTTPVGRSPVSAFALHDADPSSAGRLGFYDA